MFSFECFVFVCVFAFVYVCVSMCVCLWVGACVGVCARARARVCVCVCVSLCMCVRARGCLFHFLLICSICLLFLSHYVLLATYYQLFYPTFPYHYFALFECSRDQFCCTRAEKRPSRNSVYGICCYAIIRYMLFCNHTVYVVMQSYGICCYAIIRYMLLCNHTVYVIMQSYGICYYAISFVCLFTRYLLCIYSYLFIH